jgi:hypothetical protein
MFDLSNLGQFAKMNACYAKLQCCQLKPPPTKNLYYSHFKRGHPCAALCCHNNVPALYEHGTKTKAKTQKPQQHANILVTFHEHFDDLSKRQKMKRSRLLPNANQEFQETEHYRNLAPRI